MLLCVSLEILDHLNEDSYGFLNCRLPLTLKRTLELEENDPTSYKKKTEQV